MQHMLALLLNLLQWPELLLDVSSSWYGCLLL
jgi:hypothetical protein